jgi:hypothetical protein
MFGTGDFSPAIRIKIKQEISEMLHLEHIMVMKRGSGEGWTYHVKNGKV